MNLDHLDQYYIHRIDQDDRYDRYNQYDEYDNIDHLDYIHYINNSAKNFRAIINSFDINFIKAIIKDEGFNNFYKIKDYLIENNFSILTSIRGLIFCGIINENIIKASKIIYHSSKITSFEGLVGTNINKILIMTNYGISSFEGLIGTNIIKLLIMTNCGISSFKGLVSKEGISNVIELYCIDNLITSFEGLAGSNVTILNCKNNKITSFKGINGSKVKLLACQNNLIRSFKTSTYLNNSKIETLVINKYISLKYIHFLQLSIKFYIWETMEIIFMDFNFKIDIKEKSLFNHFERINKISEKNNVSELLFLKIKKYF